MAEEKIYYQPILITEEYLKAYSPIPENFDWKEVRTFVGIAESVWIVDILGLPLYNELIEQVAENVVTDVNSTLLLKIYPLEANAILYESLPFVWTHISEKGLTLGKSDNSESITSKDLSELQNHLRSQLSVLARQLKDFLEEHKDCYPLYQSDDCKCKVKNDEVYMYRVGRNKVPRNF